MKKIRENTDNVVVLFPLTAVTAKSAPIARPRKLPARVPSVRRSGLGRGLSAIIQDWETPDYDKLFQRAGPGLPASTDDYK